MDLGHRDRVHHLFGVLLFVLWCVSEKPCTFIEGKSLDKLKNDVEFWPIVDVAAFVREPESASERTWLEENFVAGTSAYYFKQQNRKGIKPMGTVLPKMV